MIVLQIFLFVFYFFIDTLRGSFSFGKNKSQQVWLHQRLGKGMRSQALMHWRSCSSGRSFCNLVYFSWPFSYLHISCDLWNHLCFKFPLWHAKAILVVFIGTILYLLFLAAVSWICLLNRNASLWEPSYWATLLVLCLCWRLPILLVQNMYYS